MPLIAITREMGSLGIEVAERVANGLGIPLIHHEIVDAAADRMRVRRSHVVRLLSGQATLWEKLTAAETSAAMFTAAEILEVACRSGGAVLRGWGGSHLLRTIRHAVCVRVCAPLAFRVGRMMERLNCDDPGLAEREIRLNDEAHGAIVRRHFGQDWQSADGYDLVLNTERLSADDAAEELVALVRHGIFEETDASRQMLHDLRLKARIRVALRVNSSTRNVRIAVDVANGHVKLAGIVEDAEQRDAVRRIAKALEPFNSLRCELRAANDLRPWGNG